MKSYRELEVYIESKRLAIEVHRMSLSLPKFELFEEGSQYVAPRKQLQLLL